MSEHYNFEFHGHKLDPYRILDIYQIKHPSQQHAIKKLLRAGRSIKTLDQDIDEVILSLQRWKEMIKEDGGAGGLATGEFQQTCERCRNPFASTFIPTIPGPLILCPACDGLVRGKDPIAPYVKIQNSDNVTYRSIANAPTP